MGRPLAGSSGGLTLEYRNCQERPIHWARSRPAICAGAATGAFGAAAPADDSACSTPVSGHTAHEPIPERSPRRVQQGWSRASAPRFGLLVSAPLRSACRPRSSTLSRNDRLRSGLSRWGRPPSPGRTTCSASGTAIVRSAVTFDAAHPHGIWRRHASRENWILTSLQRSRLDGRASGGAWRPRASITRPRSGRQPGRCSPRGVSPCKSSSTPLVRSTGRAPTLAESLRRQAPRRRLGRRRRRDHSPRWRLAAHVAPPRSPEAATNASRVR
jgi:hypothetical protein